MIRLVIALILLMPAFAQAQDTLPGDPLRGMVWGVSMQDVRTAEHGTFVGEQDGRLFYMDNIRVDDKHLYHALIEYRFDKEALTAMRYDFTIDKTRPGDSLDDMMAIEGWLDTIFAQTSKPDFTFRNNAERDDPTRWGWAIFRGDASVKIDWRTPRTQARLTLSGKEYEPDMILILSRAKNPATP